MHRLSIVAALFFAIVMLVAVDSSATAQTPLTPIEQLGEFLFFDEDLSEPAGQSCASCHDPAFGFVDPDVGQPVSEGVIPGLFGGRNSPSAAYAMYAPKASWETDEDGESVRIGGQFWDSRATGEVLGDPLADQALGPFLNPVEMANTSKDQVITDIAASEYAYLFEVVWGNGSLNNVEEAYDNVALSIAAFERTALFAPFSSKYDAYLQACLAEGGDKVDCAKGIGPSAENAGKIFSKKEWQGLQLFMNENNNNDGVLGGDEGAMCVACHVVEWTAPDPDNVVVVPAWSPTGFVPPLFTDFTYDNLGVPKSTDKLLENAPVDYGLGDIVGDAEDGKFKVMTLRNIAITKPYAHNGLFNKLEDITHFYNTRDVAGAWPDAEVEANVNTDELGNLGLSEKDEDALVKFMKTLTDGYQP